MNNFINTENIPSDLMEGFREEHEDAHDVSCESAFFDYLSYFVGRIRRISPRIRHSLAHYELPTMALPPIPLLVSQ